MPPAARRQLSPRLPGCHPVGHLPATQSTFLLAQYVSAHSSSPARLTTFSRHNSLLAAFSYGLPASPRVPQMRCLVQVLPVAALVLWFPTHCNHLADRLANMSWRLPRDLHQPALLPLASCRSTSCQWRDANRQPHVLAGPLIPGPGARSTAAHCKVAPGPLQ